MPHAVPRAPTALRNRLGSAFHRNQRPAELRGRPAAPPNTDGAAAGETGIVRMLELLEDEVIRTLGLLGATSFAEVGKSMLHPATPTSMPSVFSAFPLLDIEPYRY